MIAPSARFARLLVFSVFSALCAVAPSYALAGSAPAAGTSRSPKLFLDEPESFFEVFKNDRGFTVRAFGILSGYASTDRLRLEVRRKGKTLDKIACEIGTYSNEGQWATFQCRGKQDLKGAGPLEAALVYWDDQAERDYLVRTFTATVQETSFNGDPGFASTPDDLLGVAYARNVPFNPDQNRGLDVEFHFWTTGEARNQRWRCSVDGEKLPDLEASQFNPWVHTGAPVEIELVQMSRGVRQSLKWYHHRVRLTTLVNGPKEPFAKMNFTTVAELPDRYTFLIDHPGQWSCDVRAEGAAGRRLAFTVTPEGKIARHPMQDAPGATPSWSNVSVVEVTFPDGAPFDERVRPDALRKSMGFGLPWPSHPGADALRALLPKKKKGSIEPKKSKK
ncbi:MAG: hypothetical protein R3B48_26285 [Kofleriaceae bacterium]